MKVIEELNTELKKYSDISDHALGEDILQFEQLESLWRSLNEITEFTQYLATKSRRKICDAKLEVIKSEEVLTKMQEEHSNLSLELQNIREMSKAVSSRIATMRNGRYAPLLNSIWSLSSRSVNAAAICQIEDFIDFLVDNLRRQEFKSGMCASLGTLANITAVPSGLALIAKKEISIMKELITIDQKFAEEQIQNMVLSLIHNLIADEDICLGMIRDGLFSYIASHIDQFKDSNIMKQTLDRASQLKYAKTIAFCNQGEIEFLHSKLAGEKYALAKKRLEIILNPDIPATPNQVRSGVMRVFA